MYHLRCHLFTEEEEEGDPEKEEGQRKMSQDIVHHTTGKEWCVFGFLGFAHFPLTHVLTALKPCTRPLKSAPWVWISYGR